MINSDRDWDATNGMRDLTELLIADGIDRAAGDLQWARNACFDGQRTVIVGEGFGPNDFGWRGWVAGVEADGASGTCTKFPNSAPIFGRN